MSIVAQLLSNRGEIAELFVRDAATLLLRFCRAILLRLVQSCYDLATTNALPQRLCYLDLVNIGASTDKQMTKTTLRLMLRGPSIHKCGTAIQMQLSIRPTFKNKQTPISKYKVQKSFEV